MTNNQKWLVGGAVLLLACLCLGAICLTGGGLAALGIIRQNSTQPEAIVTEVSAPTTLPDLTKATTTAAPTTAAQAVDTPVPSATLELAPTQTPVSAPAGPTGQTASGQAAQETLNTLENSIVPINDPRDLVKRLQNVQNIPATMEPPKQPLQVGAHQEFWGSNQDTNKNFKINATLQYATDHLYFWIQDGLSYSPGALKDLAETFETKIYPTDRAFFGSEWSPGIDGDVHLYAVYARGLGNSVAGYFSSADELPPQAHPYSNAHEMFMLNADASRLDDTFMKSVMAHEFQHMIHWFRDRNEEAWMNEGFSVLAESLNGYEIGGFDSAYIADPDIQLNDWPAQGNDTIPHYGNSFLFLAYFLDRFGEKATQALVANPDNGLDSVDKVLASLKETDPKTNKPIQADDFFADWAVTSYLNNSSAGDGRYVYKQYKSAPQPDPTEQIQNCSPDWQKRTVHQYGVDYIKIGCTGSYTLQFKGATEVGVLPGGAHSGNYAFWSNKGDESDMTLTREFDFSKVSGPLSLKYFTWYDLEKDYDYAYLEVSEDGSNWQILKTPSGRDKSLDPSGNSFGWGYNGQSGGWKEENVDLSAYAGKKVQVRFEYVTDAEVNLNGILLDDISIPQINYTENFENGDGGWQGKGFVRIQNGLPQTYRVSLILEGKTISVQNITLDGNETAAVPLNLSGDVQDAILVVSGTTRFTTQEADYQFSFQK